MGYKFFKAQEGMTTCGREEVALLGVWEYLPTPACPHLSQVLMDFQWCHNYRNAGKC